MKIRTDFVTNSSSSSFVFMLQINLKNGKHFDFRGVGSCWEGPAGDFESLHIMVSPRELGQAESVQSMIQMLKTGIKNGDCKLFDTEDHARRKELKRLHNLGAGELIDSYDQAAAYIDSLSDIPDMDAIRSITISGDEYGYTNEYGYMNQYLRTYTYDRTTDEYRVSGSGFAFENDDGGSGGNLQFKDWYLANVFSLTKVDFINFNKRSFAFTGFSESKKADLARLITAKGGKVSDKVNLDTNYLVVNTSYHHPTRKYNDAIKINDTLCSDYYSWKPHYVGIINEGMLRAFAALPSGQVREGGSPLRYVQTPDGHTYLADISHTVKDLVVDGPHKVLACAFAGMKALDSVTLTNGAYLLANIDMPIKQAILDNPYYLKSFQEGCVQSVEMPVIAIGEFKRQDLKICAIRNFLRKMQNGENIEPAVISSYNSYMKLRRKVLFALPDNRDILYYLAKNGLLTDSDTKVLLQWATDAELIDLLSAPKKAKTSDMAGHLWSRKNITFRMGFQSTKYSTIYHYKGNDQQIVVPATIKDYPVNMLGAYLFSPFAEGLTDEQINHRKSITRIEIQEGVEYIDETAFLGCDNLKEIIFPDSIRGIIVHERNRSNKLLSVFDQVPMPPKYYGLENAFLYHHFDEECLQIPSEVTDIGQCAYQNTTGLKEVLLHNGITNIGLSAFSESELETITLPENLQVLSGWAFCNCSKLRSVQLNSNLREIKSGTFVGCISLKELFIPEGVESIDDNAFDYNSLESLYLPYSIQRISYQPFGWIGLGEQSAIKIYVKAGSYAERRMKEMGFPVENY